MEKRFLTARELAKRWNVGVRKIYTMKDSGEIPYTQLGGNIRFPLEQIEEYEQTHTVFPKEKEEPQQEQQE